MSTLHQWISKYEHVLSSETCLPEPVKQEMMVKCDEVQRIPQQGDEEWSSGPLCYSRHSGLSSADAGVEWVKAGCMHFEFLHGLS